MWGLQGFTYNNVVLFDKVDVDTSNVGLVVINGVNKDADIKDVTNGAGKSLLFTPLASLIFDSVPLSTLKRGSKKDLLAKESSAQFRFKRDNQTLEVTQTAGSYSLVHNGKQIKSLKEGRQDTAKEWISKFCPVTEEEFYTYAYIHTQRNHPFQRAKPAERLAYITQVFNLNVYDKLRQHFSQLLTQAKDKVKVAEIYAEDLRQAQSVLETLQFKNVDVLGRRVEAGRTKLDKLKHRRSELEVQTYAYKQSRIVKQKLREIGKIKDPEILLDELGSALELSDDYEAYIVRKEEFDKQKTRLESKLDSLPETKPKYNQAQLDDDSYELESNLKSRMKKVRASESLVEEIKKDKRTLKARDPLSYALDTAEEELQVSRRTLNMCAKLEDHAECPTCKQDIDPSHLAQLKKQAQRLYKKAEYDLETFELQDALNSKINTLEVLDVEIEQADRNIADITSKYKFKASEGLLALVERNREQTETHLKRKELSKQLDELREPKPVAEPEMTRAEIRSRGKEVEKYIQLKEQLSELDNVPDEDPKPELDELEATISELAAKLNTDSDSLNSYVLKNERYTLTKERIDELESKLEGLGDAVEDKRCLEMLYKAYSNTKLKLNAANEVLSALESELNALAPLVFPEKVKFELGTNAQGVYALASFAHSKKAADIYTLSGAESNCFRLLFALAILTFVPPDRRPNFMILDEPESNCGKSVRRQMIKEFLPKLQSVVPNIFWITPLDVDMFGDARKWTVTKQGGKSTLSIT